ncbi:hypothetical protein JCM21714_1742 [Gracilibacillus boraciitolerans JCM 21714]|uniref:Uncharacterized protein n=1 Tax=Gracilibacillus boraciitolerans JCM 21714 TaxID=1298598 RepID=W4VH49_9BACI|nr:hypothetical protein [Gracilibacillus boraciitolerans]GAE92730.1 hypothetical protein JCM21714_1742 [Gracilibacillus boraciitolerans JCM 21714]
MGNGIDIKSYVNENTIRYGIGEISEISSLKVQEQLVQIEEYLQKFCMHQKKLTEEIKQFSKLSISFVSSGANVPRSQVNLNFNTLKLYIEKRISEIEKKDLLKINKNERLRIDKRELDMYIDGLRQQVVDTCEMKLYIENLEKENKRLIRQLEDRQKDIQKLEVENSKLRKAVNEANSKKVLPLDNNLTGGRFRI